MVRFFFNLWFNICGDILIYIYIYIYIRYSFFGVGGTNWNPCNGSVVEDVLLLGCAASGIFNYKRS